MNKLIQQQQSLRDLVGILDSASELLETIEQRALYDNPEKLSFEQQIIDCVRKTEAGSPVRDFLSDEQIEKAISILADIYTVTGVKMPVDWF